MYGTNMHERLPLLTEKDFALQKAIEIVTAAEMDILQGTQPTTVWESEEEHTTNFEKQCQCYRECGHSTATCQLCQNTCHSYGEQGHIHVRVM